MPANARRNRSAKQRGEPDVIDYRQMSALDLLKHLLDIGTIFRGEGEVEIPKEHITLGAP